MANQGKSARLPRWSDDDGLTRLVREQLSKWQALALEEEFEREQQLADCPDAIPEHILRAMMSFSASRKTPAEDDSGPRHVRPEKPPKRPLKPWYIREAIKKQKAQGPRRPPHRPKLAADEHHSRFDEAVDEVLAVESFFKKWFPDEKGHRAKAIQIVAEIYGVSETSIENRFKDRNKKNDRRRKHGDDNGVHP